MDTHPLNIELAVAERQARLASERHLWGESRRGPTPRLPASAAGLALAAVVLATCASFAAWEPAPTCPDAAIAAVDGPPAVDRPIGCP